MLMMVLAHRPSPCHPTQHSATVMRYTRRNYILCQTQNTILTCFSAKQAFMDWHVWLISTKMSFFFGSVHFHIVWPRGQCLPFNLIVFFFDWDFETLCSVSVCIMYMTLFRQCYPPCQVLVAFALFTYTISVAPKFGRRLFEFIIN